MKNCSNKKHIKKASQAITGGLAAFLVVGLAGCGDKGDPNCKDLAYAPQWRIDECKQQDSKLNSYAGSGSQNSGQTHSTGSSWLPLWLLMNSSVNSANSTNAHSGYTYSFGSSSKSTSFFSSSSSGSSGSSGG